MIDFKFTSSREEKLNSVRELKGIKNADLEEAVMYESKPLIKPHPKLIKNSLFFNRHAASKLVSQGFTSSNEELEQVNDLQQEFEPGL